jgi:iron complex outermembrane receptor protein
MFDLERVEVLRGPQGTLYGRNTTGGVVNLVSRRPENRNGFEAMVGFGNHSQLDLQGAANVVLNDSTAARISFVIHERDSIFENTNGTGDPSDVSNWGARGMFSFGPSDAQEWLLNVYGSSVDEAARGRDRSSVAATPDRMDPGTVRSEPLTRAGWDRVDIAGGTLSGTFDFSSVELASVTGFLNSRRDSRDDLDSQAPDILDDKRRNEADQFSQEFRLSSASGGDLDWTVGAYYFLEDLDGSVVLDANDLLGASFHSVTEFAQETASGAVFADVTYALTDRWLLTGGARWTYEEKDYAVQREGFFNAPLVTDRAVNDWAEPSGGVGIEYLFSEDVMAYLKFTRGFRAGGYNAGSSLPNPQFDPEFVKSWEAGLKSTWLQDSLRVNVSAFSNQYEDMQVFTLVTPPAGGPPVQFLTNAAESRIKGLEVELAWRPTTNLQFDLAAGHLDAEFTDYIDDTNTDRSGNKLIASPELTLSGMLHYTIPLPSGAVIRMTADGSYRDDYYFDAANTERTASHAYWLTGARVSYTSSSERLGISIWGRNLGDEVYVDRVATFVGIDSILIGNPRTYGVEFTLRL